MTLIPNAGNEELKSLDQRVSFGQSAANAITSLFTKGAAALSNSHKAVLAAVVIPFMMSSYNAQGQTASLDSLKSQTNNEQKWLFDDLAQFLYKVETHKWWYTNWSKSSLDLTKNTNVKLNDLLSKNQSSLSKDDEIKLKSEMKQILTDSLADKLFEAVSKTIISRNVWYKSPGTVNHNTHLQEIYPFNPDVDFYKVHTSTTIQSKDSILPEFSYKSYQGWVIHKKYIKDLIKEISKLNTRQSGAKPTKDEILSIAQKIWVTPVSGWKYKKNPNKVAYVDFSAFTKDIDALLHLPAGKKLNINQIQWYIKAWTFTPTNIQTYLDPANKLAANAIFVKKDVSGTTIVQWKNTKTSSLVIPSGKTPESLETEWERDLLSTYTEALKTYKTDLESTDINKRKIAEQNFAIAWYNLMMKKIDVHVTTYLDLTVKTFTTAPDAKK